MDWDQALEHLPHRLVVTDKKGRVLLLSGDVPGVRVGRSFLKLVDKEDLMTLGRAAKRALKDGTPRKLATVIGVDKSQLGIRLIPFSPSGGTPDHLLVMVGDAEPLPAVTRQGTPAPAPRRATPAPAPGRAAPELAEAPTMHSVTPGTAEQRAASPLPPVAPPTELVVVAAGGTLPLARALSSVLQGRLTVKAVPVATFVEALAKRTGGTEPDKVDGALSSATRLLFIGDSPYSNDTRKHALRQNVGGSSGWAIAGKIVRRAAAWPGEPPADRPGELVADLQFEMMEVVRRAMPIRRNGRLQEVPDGLKQAAAFLEQPAAMDMTGDLMTQARHHQLVMAIARFLQEGLDTLLGDADG